MSENITILCQRLESETLQAAVQGINYHQNKHHNSDVNMQHSRSPQLFNSNSSDGRGAPNAASGYKTHLSGE